MKEAPAFLHLSFDLRTISQLFKPDFCLHFSPRFVSHSLARVNTAYYASFFILVSPVMIPIESHACNQRD